MFNKNLSLKSLLLPLFLFFSTVLIYLHNLSASVYGGDSGDFLSAIVVKGVAHPSGYPLYTILGIIFNAIPIHNTTAWKVDLLSAILSSFAVVLLYWIIDELLKSKLYAGITALTLAFTFPFWLFAEMTEVFALHHLLLLLIFFFSLLLYKKKRIFYLYLLVFSTGLSLSNHELTLFLIPSVLVLIIAVRKLCPFNIKVLLITMLVFLLGLLPYLYIPIAASQNPPVNWDHASILGNFIHLVLRSDYGWTTHANTNLAIRFLSVSQYIGYIFTNIPLIVLLFIPVGIYSLIRGKQYSILSSVAIAFILFGPFLFFYNAFVTTDDFHYGIYEKFYTSSIIFLLIFFAYGLKFAIDFLISLISHISPMIKARPIYSIVFSSVFILIPFSLFLNNFDKTDLHAVTVGDKLGRDTINSLPNGSYLIGKNDNIGFNSRYIAYSQNPKKQITISTPADTYIYAHDASSRRLQVELQNIGNNNFDKVPHLIKSNSIFITVDNYHDLTQQEKSRLIPYGLLFRVIDTQENMSKNDFINQQLTLLKAYSASSLHYGNSFAYLKLVSDIPILYANAYNNTGNYLIDKYGAYESSKSYFQNALSYYPNSDSAYEGLGDYYFYKGECVKAKENYVIASSLSITNFSVYAKLYKVVSSCLHDTRATENLHQFFLRYPNIFKNIVNFHGIN